MHLHFSLSHFLFLPIPFLQVTPQGKKRVLANANINMRKYASIESTQQSFTLNLKPVSRKVTAADLELTISCVFLREGKATLVNWNICSEHEKYYFCLIIIAIKM